MESVEERGDPQKQEAEQFALRAQRDLDRIKIEVEQIELRKIEALREAIAKWNGTVPNALLSGGGATPLLSLDGLMKK